MNLNKRETATVLAALRMWQDPVRVPPAEHFAEVHELSTEEIDVLCEKINCDPPAAVKPVEHKRFDITCTISVSTGHQFDPDEIAERVREEIAGAVEDDRDRERDFEYVDTTVRATYAGAPEEESR